MNDLKLWERQASLNDQTVKFAQEVDKQIKILSWGLISTTTGLLILFIAILTK